MKDAKSIKDIDKLYEKAMKDFFDEIKGQILYCRSQDYRQILVVDITLTCDLKLKVVYLTEEKTQMHHYVDWHSFRSDHLTHDEWEEKKDVLTRLVEIRKKRKLCLNNPNPMPNHRPKRMSKPGRII